jgi:hypothetical protein
MIEFMQEHFILFPLVITTVTAGLYMFGMPFGLFKYKIAGNNILGLSV